jgi:tRNA A37 threonylcarbamoyltransferase TsaD
MARESQTYSAGWFICRYGNNGMTIRSPDLSEAAGDFSWGYLKSSVYATKTQNNEELKVRILGEIAAIYRVLRSVIKFFIEHVQKCIAMYYLIELIITN